MNNTTCGLHPSPYPDSIPGFSHVSLICCYRLMGGRGLFPQAFTSWFFFYIQSVGPSLGPFSIQNCFFPSSSRSHHLFPVFGCRSNHWEQPSGEVWPVTHRGSDHGSERSGHHPHAPRGHRQPHQGVWIFCRPHHRASPRSVGVVVVLSVVPYIRTF